MNKAERTRAFIIEKTAPVFNMKGYAGTSLTDMTEATGLTKGSIYGNFDSKDDVALAAFDHNVQQVTDIIRKEMAQASTCRGKLMAYVKVYGNCEKYNFPEGGCPLLNTATEADHTHPALRAKVVEVISSWKKSMMELIKKGIAEKEFKHDTDAEQTTLTIIAMIEGSMMLASVMGKPAYRKTIMKSLESMIAGL